MQNTKHDAHEEEIASADGQKIKEWLAVLSAQRLAYSLARTGHIWRILTGQTDAERARSEIAAYEADETQRMTHLPAPRLPELPSHRSWSPAWVALFLLGMFIWTGPYHGQHALLQRAILDPRAILNDHEWWRLITALCVHGDAEHLAGNILALFFLSRQVCRRFGAGLGWSMILGATIAGNALAVILQPVTTRSFGASTAGFAALGIAAATQMIRQTRLHGLAWSVWGRAWIPLGAGISLLAFMGTAPQSDLRAHCAGFICGCLTGLLFSLIPLSWCTSRIQHALLAACLALFLVAWRLAVM